MQTSERTEGGMNAKTQVARFGMEQTSRPSSGHWLKQKVSSHQEANERPEVLKRKSFKNRNQMKDVTVVSPNPI